jgi:hypothetical protein
MGATQMGLSDRITKIGFIHNSGIPLSARMGLVNQTAEPSFSIFKQTR